MTTTCRFRCKVCRRELCLLQTVLAVAGAHWQRPLPVFVCQLHDVADQHLVDSRSVGRRRSTTGRHHHHPHYRCRRCLSQTPQQSGQRKQQGVA